jgi:hypothetical protein
MLMLPTEAKIPPTLRPAGAKVVVEWQQGPSLARHPRETGDKPCVTIREKQPMAADAHRNQILRPVKL